MGALVDQFWWSIFAATQSWPYALACLLLPSIHFYLRGKKQIYAQAPIAAIPDHGALPETRERFRLEAEQMLAEGYSQVRMQRLRNLGYRSQSPSSRISRSIYLRL